MNDFILMPLAISFAANIILIVSCVNLMGIVDSQAAILAKKYKDDDINSSWGKYLLFRFKKGDSK